VKKTAFALSLLLLASCASPTKDVAGKVVSCAQVRTATTPNLKVIGCLDGSTGAAIKSLRGPMILNVWGSWCAPCKAEIPILRSFYQKAQGKIQLVGVDVEESSIQAGQNFVLKHGITWPNLFDSDSSTRENFGMGVPVTWFIAADGTVVYKMIGPFKNDVELITIASKYLGVKL